MQKYNPLRKGTAVVILVLFIGMSIIPSTVGLDKSSMSTFDDITIVSFQPSTTNVEQGETFDVSVWVYPGEPIVGISFEYLYFDETIIHANSPVTFDDFFDPYSTLNSQEPPHLEIDNVNGEIRYIWEGILGSGSVTSNGSFVTINFTAQNVGGVSLLELDGVEIINPDINLVPTTINNGIVIVEEPPQITDVTVLHSIPKDTDPDYGWENFTCTVTDDVAVDTVQLNITYPDSSSHTFPMTKNADTYYYNTSLTQFGGENTPGYNYHIYATDASGKESTSPSDLFKLPMNADVNEDGSIGFVDIMSVAGMWMLTGPPGWMRADVNNDGEVGFGDIMWPCGLWGQEW